MQTETYAVAVHTNVQVSGPTESMEGVAIHEIPLARRKLQMEGGEALTIVPAWEPTVPRFRAMSRDDLYNEAERLRERYTVQVSDTRVVDLVADVFGVENGGVNGLQAAMNRVHSKFAADYANSPIAVTEQNLEDLVLLVLNEVGRVDDLIPMNAETLEKEEDAAEAANEAGGIDGGLVTHLTNAGLDPSIATSLARFVLESDTDEYDDDDIATAANIPASNAKRGELIAFIRGSISEYEAEPATTES